MKWNRYSLNALNFVGACSERRNWICRTFKQVWFKFFRSFLSGTDFSWLFHEVSDPGEVLSAGYFWRRRFSETLTDGHRDPVYDVIPDTITIKVKRTRKLTCLDCQQCDCTPSSHDSVADLELVPQVGAIHGYPSTGVHEYWTPYPAIMKWYWWINLSCSTFLLKLGIIWCFGGGLWGRFWKLIYYIH